MNFHVTFTNGMQELSRNFDFYGLTPVELSVPRGGKSSRMRSLSTYVKTLVFAFTGVGNRASGAIDELEIGKDWCGTIKKKGDSISWDFVKDKQDVIVYNISATEIQESMYTADKVQLQSSKLVPEWSKRLFLPTPDDTRGKVVSAIEVFAKYIPNYSLEWKGNLVLKNDKGMKISSMDDIKEDDIYTLLKVITIILKKSQHLGVFFINVEGFRDNTLLALFDFLKKVYGDAFVFLYNCGTKCKVERELLQLPNIYIKEGALR